VRRPGHAPPHRAPAGPAPCRLGARTRRRHHDRVEPHRGGARHVELHLGHRWRAPRRGARRRAVRGRAGARPSRAGARRGARAPRRPRDGRGAGPVRRGARPGPAGEPAHRGDALGAARAPARARGMGAPRARALRRERRWRVSRVAPGPRGWEVVSTLLRLRRDPLRSFLAARARWGPCVRVPLGKRTFYLIADPAGARRVLCDNARNCTKDTWSFGLLRGALGEGLLTGDGAVWRAQRRRAQPAFSRARIQALADTVVAHTDYMLAAWPADGDVDVGAEMVRVTLRIMSSAMLGVDVAREVTEISRHLSGVLAYMRDRTASLIGWPRAARRFRAHVAALDGVVDGIIRARRAAPGSRADALSALLEARDEDGSALADDEICAQVKTFLLAGHETTASLLTWTLGLLAAHPAAVDRARTAPDTVFKEALRLYPPLWLVQRPATLPDEI